MINDPQNPYQSCVVRASAGSGKTYQLSQRFLYLVAAGSAPSSILTVTFTKKAAAEMRERILDSAAQLLREESTREAFDRRIQDFYRLTPHKGGKPQPPRSAKAAAEAILASTQSLRIATIDSILLEWMRKFPYEASGGGTLPLPSPFELVTLRDSERLHRRAWHQAVLTLKQDNRLKQLWAKVQEQGIDLLELEHRILELSRHKSFLWLIQRQKANTSLPIMIPHPVPEHAGELGPKDFLESIQDWLQALLSLLPAAKAQDAGGALATLDIELLIELRILTKTWEVHGGTFRKPKRDAFEGEIESINASARLIRAYQTRSKLNDLGQLLIDLYQIYESSLQIHKKQNSKLEFSDLIKGAYHIFQNADAAGVRYLLHRSIRHLLLDEFQDTSILQWTMFRSMAEELLAGNGLEDPTALPGSIFIVGDAKQSIYGFREAEAEVLDEAAQYLLDRQALDVNLSVSYRTAPTLLRLVNTVFANLWPEFPHHETAQRQGIPVAPGAASIELVSLFEQSTAEDPVGAEAEYIATRLRAWIEDPQTPAIFDKKTDCWRRPHAGDCAILYRNSTHAAVYAAALRQQNFAVRLEDGHSFFERLEILDLMAFCRWMSFPSHTEALIQVLKSPLFRVPDALLLNALHATQESRSQRSARHSRLLGELHEVSSGPIARLQRLLQLKNSLHPYTLLTQALEEGDWLASYQLAFGEEGPLAVANICRFMETVAQFETQGCYDWLPLLQKLEDAAAEKTIALASVSDRAIQLMTIHKAKGLEFPMVILAGTGEEWERLDRYWAKLKSGPEGAGLAYMGRKIDRTAEDPHFESMHQELMAQSHQENLRLLYVALTRAQYHLLITGHQRKRSVAGFFSLLEQAAEQMGAIRFTAHEKHSLRLLAPACSLAATTNESTTSREPRASSFAAWQANEPVLGSIRILAPARLLQDAQVSTPHPQRAREPGHDFKMFPYAREMGVFIHQGLEAAVKGETLPGADTWLSLQPSRARRESFRDAYNYVAERLHKILNSTRWQDLWKHSRQKFVELPIAFLQGSYLVRGTLDLLVELEPDHWLVIDYKTVEDLPQDIDYHALIRERHYDQQLALYQEGVQLLYPGSRVDTAVFFTDRGELVFLQAPQSSC